MDETLFKVVVLELFGICIGGGILTQYFTDGRMPRRRRVGLFFSALIIIIGICVYFEVPVFWTIWDFIADMPCMEDVSEKGVSFVAYSFFGIMGCIIIAIFISVWKGRVAPLSKEMGIIALTGLIGLSLGLLGLIPGLTGLLLGLREPLRLYEILPESLTMGLMVGLLGGLLGLVP